MTLLVTRPRRSLAMYPALGLPVTSGAPVDIEETSEAFRIELDLPGVAPGDVEIELRDSELRVFGSFQEKHRIGTLRHHARRTGEFEYLIALPTDVDADAVEADLDGGVLTIVAPKLHEQQARRIAIQERSDTRTGRLAAAEGRAVPEGVRPEAPDTPAAQAKQMKEGQSRPGPASQTVGSTGVGSTGQVGRSATA